MRLEAPVPVYSSARLLVYSSTRLPVSRFPFPVSSGSDSSRQRIEGESRCCRGVVCLLLGAISSGEGGCRVTRDHFHNSAVRILRDRAARIEQQRAANAARPRARFWLPSLLALSSLLAILAFLAPQPFASFCLRSSFTTLPPSFPPPFPSDRSALRVYTFASQHLHTYTHVHGFGYPSAKSPLSQLFPPLCLSSEVSQFLLPRFLRGIFRSPSNTQLSIYQTRLSYRFRYSVRGRGSSTG